MSITFYINNNEAYIDEHAPETIIRNTEKCSCVDFNNGKPYPDCDDCKGTGIYTYPPRYPFEMNISNMNACTLFAALGLEFDYCGTINAQKLLTALRLSFPALMTRETVESHEAGSVHYIDVGIDEERAKYYIDTLSEIANEAARREETIHWC